MLPQISQPLKLWEKIEIIVGEDDKQGLYTARIEDLFENSIIITCPVYQNGETLLRDNCQILVLFTKEDAVYQFYSIIKKLSANKKNLYILSPPENIKRVQRRNFVRIELSGNIAYANIGSSFKNEEIVWQEADCANLSGGGLLIKGTEDINISDLILVKADIFSKIKICQPAAMVCIRHFCQNEQQCFGLEFIRSDYIYDYFDAKQLKALPSSITLFDRITQNRLVNYIFKHQIEMRKKGLL